ncbi:hypothetical protein M407DRAFT_11907, partial [Tulasnella calospora MUT 4182]
RLMKKTYIQAIASYTEAAERLKSLKRSLGTEAVLKLQLEYEEAGGEQFVENTENVKWLSRKELMRQMATLEYRSDRDAHSDVQKSSNLINLICKALQLEELQ